MKKQEFYETRDRDSKGKWTTIDRTGETLTGEKPCIKCGLVKPLSEFSFLKREKILKSRCKACLREDSRLSRLKNPEAHAGYQKKYHENNIFGSMRRCMKKIESKGFPRPVPVSYLKGLWEKQNGKCYWSGMDMFKGHGRGINPKMVSPDRLDRTKGYVEGNIVLCCVWTNYGRSTVPVDTWISLLKELGIKGLWT